MRQTIWVYSRAATFSDVCEACLADRDEWLPLLGYRAAVVEGTLRLDADVGFAACRRGHRICVRRVARAPVDALR